MKRLWFPTLLTLAILLAACTATATPLQPMPDAVNNASSESDFATRTDQQGAMMIDVTPRNFSMAADYLEFDIAMNTPYIDLNMDIATLSTLTTDTGVAVSATTWDAALGGHHVEGTLIFPSMQDGKFILQDAGKITLTINNVDAPARVFEWTFE
jgi:hypothetical protein